MPSRRLPTPDEERILHRKLLDSDPVAPSQVADAYIDPLIARLERRNRKMWDQHQLVDAAHCALIEFIKKPTLFKPEKSKSAQPLFAFLCMAAEGDLKNLLAKEGRHWKQRETTDSVDLSNVRRKTLRSNDDPALPLIIAEETRSAIGGVVDIAEGDLSESEKLGIRMLLSGERKTAAFAEILGLQHLSIQEQRLRVKRFKDTMKQRLKRARAEHDESS